MEFKTDLIINDCTYAIAKHTPNLQGQEFRLNWWTIISLLRAIGHVLHNVDSKISTIHKKIIDEEFKKLKQSYPKPEIYWEFIEKQRNEFLKEYKHGVRRQLTVSNGEGKNKSSVSIIVDDLPDHTFTVQNSFPESFIQDGYFKGCNERQLSFEAVNWWKFYIENIKKKITETK